MADFQWDSEKESLNIEKHRLDFETASQIWVSQIIEKSTTVATMEKPASSLLARWTDVSS